MIALVCFALFSFPLVRGLSRNEISLSFEWSNSAYYQGDYGGVTISLNSTCDNELEFTWVGIHFAWMRENSYHILDLSSNPMKIPSGGFCTFLDIDFSVSSNASVGWNGYYVRIHYNEGGTSGRVWTSPTYQINIHDAYEKTYNDLRPQVLSEIESADYESPDAKSLLSQAVNEYDLAVSLANQEKWKEAVSNLQTASNLLAQASAKEEEYQSQQQQQGLETWRQKALDSINTAGQKINQLLDCESSEARSLLQQAQTQLTNAQNSLDQETLQSYKDAYNYALQASSYADQASNKEQEYQKENGEENQLEKQEVFNIIQTAEEKISQIMDVESPDAKRLLQQAQNQLIYAKTAYNQQTIDGYKTAYYNAQQAIAYAGQAYTKEQTYQQGKQRQQQLFLIVVGTSALVIIAIAVMALEEKQIHTRNQSFVSPFS